MNSLSEFQFKNILQQNVPHKIFSVDVEDLDAQLENWLKAPLFIKCLRWESTQHVSERVQDQQFPLIIVCKNGESSSKKVQELQDLGYVNAYFLEKGIQSFRE